MNKYSKTYTITNNEMNFEYRLSPIAAAMFFQDCFARYLTVKNLAAFDIAKQNLLWVISEFQLECLNNLPFWSEEIKVETWISETTKLKIYNDFVLYYKNTPFIKGNCCWLLLDSISKKPVCTDMIANKLDILNDLSLGLHKKISFPIIKEKIKEIMHTTNLSDMDFNNHVNNKSYLNIATRTLPDEFAKTHRLKILHVKFHKESFLNDVLCCEEYSTSEENSFIHKINKDDSPICTIYTNWQKYENQKDCIQTTELQLKNMQ